MDVNCAIHRKNLVLIGESAVDIALYISKMCSFNQKILFVDLSKDGTILDIVSPDGVMENQSIHYTKQVNPSVVYQYDLLIVYSNEIEDIPGDFYCDEIFLFISSRKSCVVRLPKELKKLEGAENIVIVFRGSDNKDIILKRLYVSGISHEVSSRVLFISENEKDSQVFRQMEYNSVFLYDSLSDDLKIFLKYVYRRVANKLFTTRDTEEVRFKWVM